MNVFKIEKTEITPEVIVDYNNNLVSISGIYLSSTPFVFFAPVLQAIECFENKENEIIELNISLEYFNSGASKALMDLFFYFKELKNVDVVVNWSTEEDDDEILDAGKLYQELSNLKFNFFTI